ncbi:hypothetical protein MTY_2616 [Moorella thermoacetica Y72]|uniref:Uncharacterized protein n=1 Tax=Moorella thermoacetica Y72 TaxID=1325331 RepID=A0A0S6UJW6_NEOTH|nr:hypothetical protein MTY_2616 [Moorella thermoacetica Y72]
MPGKGAPGPAAGPVGGAVPRRVGVPVPVLARRCLNGGRHGDGSPETRTGQRPGAGPGARPGGLPGVPGLPVLRVEAEGELGSLLEKLTTILPCFSPAGPGERRVNYRPAGETGRPCRRKRDGGCCRRRGRNGCRGREAFAGASPGPGRILAGGPGAGPFPGQYRTSSHTPGRFKTPGPATPGVICQGVSAAAGQLLPGDFLPGLRTGLCRGRPGRPGDRVLAGS